MRNLPTSPHGTKGESGFMRTISGLSCLLLLIAATPLTQSQSSPAQNPGDAKAAPTVYSQVPQANVLYIQGLDYLSKSNTWMEGGSLVNAREAVRLFSQAVKRILNSRSHTSA